MKSKGRVGRRGFLKGAAASAAAGAAAIVGPVPVLSAQAQQAAAEPQRGTAPSPSASQLAAETEPVSTSVDVADLLTVENPGSDFMVDVLKSIGFEYVAA